jgi:predicted RNA-binding Zn ribbon-like protein
VPRYDVPNAAPEPLRLVQLFVNTSDHEHTRELLPTAEALGAWLEEHSLAPRDDLVEADLRRAVDLREALRSLLQANNGIAVEPGVIATVNHAARAAAIGVELDAAGKLRIEPHGRGADGSLGGILSVAIAAMLDGSWPRLKACRNCGFAFYDYSKNRSASWCSMLLCGNRAKTKAYRRRKAQR